MKKTKFTFNSLLLIVAIFSALVLFIGITMVDMATILPVEDSYRIGDTEYFVRYSSFHPYGIYRGNDQLVLKGSYGHDWGAALVGNTYYCNEMKDTDFGLMVTDVVKIDLTTFKKETVLRNSMIRGKCASGELIIYEGYISPTWSPDVNPFRCVFRVSDSKIQEDADAAVVSWYDTSSDSIVYSKTDPNAHHNKREEYYISRTLEKVRGK